MDVVKILQSEIMNMRKVQYAIACPYITLESDTNEFYSVTKLESHDLNNRL
jgi:hypothetical protein